MIMIFYVGHVGNVYGLMLIFVNQRIIIITNIIIMILLHEYIIIITYCICTSAIELKRPQIKKKQKIK